MAGFWLCCFASGKHAGGATEVKWATAVGRDVKRGRMDALAGRALSGGLGVLRIPRSGGGISTPPPWAPSRARGAGGARPTQPQSEERRGGEKGQTPGS